jgi:gluconate kinase
MKKSRLDLGIAGIMLFACAWMVLSGVSTATPAIQKSAKAAGIAADNCLYCHVEKMPKKDAVTENDRGKWLVAEKAKRNAKEVDGAWLKDYPAK